MLVGLKELASPNDSLRYSLDPKYNFKKYSERKGIIEKGHLHHFP